MYSKQKKYRRKCVLISLFILTDLGPKFKARNWMKTPITWQLIKLRDKVFKRFKQHRNIEKRKYYGSSKGQNFVRENSSYTIEIGTISLLNLDPEKFWKYRITFPYWSVFNLSLRLGLFYHVKITLKKTFAHVKKSSGAWAKSFFSKINDTTNNR